MMPIMTLDLWLFDQSDDDLRACGWQCDHQGRWQSKDLDMLPFSRREALLFTYYAAQCQEPE